MDPVSDLPPLPDKSTASVPATATPANAPAPAHNHPPYAEMITAAISALNEVNGSSKNAIAKYIETHYTDLPSTHAALFAHHLKELKINRQLLMVKHSYKLPRSAPAPVNGDANSISSDPASALPKRRPGRPPKIKPDSVQVAVPVFEPPININALPVVVPGEELQQNVAIETVNGPAAAAGPPARGRGRPPKQVGLKRGAGRPPKSSGRGRPKVAAPVVQGRQGSGKPRGRPPKSTSVIQGPDPGEMAVVALEVGIPDAVDGGAELVSGKRRGRPPRTVGEIPVAVGGGVEPVSGKRRGRPSRAGGGEAKRPRNVDADQQKKPRKLSGKTLGRPKKNTLATAVNRSPDSQLLVAYLDLKAKLENLQSRIGQTANLIKPSLNNEAAINALQELELIAMNVTTPAVAHHHHQQLQPPPQPPPGQ